MKKVYTFSQLGNWGGLGNQLWELAGVVGRALQEEALAYFPEWDYQPYFSVPKTFYELHSGGEVVDFYPDYMQNLEHFKGFEHVVRRIFQPSKGILFEIEDLDLANRTAIHVRHGDYVRFPNHHPIVPLDYYEQAIDMVGPSGLLVCSDDLEWCKQQSLFRDAMFGRGTPAGVELTNPIAFANREAAIDLHMMARCKNHIIANSTLGWWSAYIADGEKVIYPSQWFGPAYAHVDTSVMFPKDWKGLSHA